LNRRASNNLVDDELNHVSTPAEVKSSYLLDPAGTRRMVWDVLGMMLIGYDLITIPLLAFNPEDNDFTTFMGWLAMIFWTLDIAASLNTAIRFQDGTVIHSRAIIVSSYVKSWFIIDLAVVVPDWTMTILQLTGGSGSGKGIARMSRILRVMRAIRILRLLRLLKLKKLITDAYDSIDSEHIFIVVNLLQLILIVLVLTHYVACIWYFLGEVTRASGSETGLNWLEDAGKIPVHGQSLTWKYLTAMHWSITQFTPASMDVSAVNAVERTFSIAILFASLVSLSSIIGSVSASMTQLRNLKGDKTKQFWMLRRYLREKRIDRQLRDRILRYSEYQSDISAKSTSAAKVPLLLQLSEPLRRELATALYTPTLAEHPVFSYLSEHMAKILERICDSIKSFTFAAGDVVFRCNEEASVMYFLRSGCFDYTLSDYKRDPPLRYREWISEVVLWSSWRYRGDLVARDTGDLLLLDPGEFAKAMSLHPRSWHFGRRYAARLVARINAMDPNKLTDMTFDDEISSIVAESDAFDDSGGRRASTTNASELALENGIMPI
jgi:hypothetical protein